MTRKPQMQSVSTWISVQSFSNALLKMFCEGNIYPDQFGDIANRR